MSSTALSLEDATRTNSDYRHVLHTTSTSQIVLYSLEEEGIPPEVHPATTQIIYAVDGYGEVVLDSTARLLLPRDGDTVVIAPKTRHVVRAVGTNPFKFWSVYSPPVFAAGHRDKRQPLGE
jgi:mannose-6-phosphate isomerase-like protein (cupin superfamily)